ncbi:MAG TPA: DNA topoisomerase IB [Candidatus Melainabacteria bacterium]|nr:DNA topoisomerase IB [Candidatus Melainabacteria bacterium]
MNDWQARAHSAGLRYIQDFGAGYTRRKCGKGFKFLDETGKVILCKETRERLLSLVIPPAWKNVWICIDYDGHIQATGIDDAGRKQYIYHPKWHEASAAHKYGRLRQFAKLLPGIRRNVQNDLKIEELNKRRVVAAVVRLLDKACLRVGNKQYLAANDSRGATTLSSEHVVRSENNLRFNFRGKSGKQIELNCSDEALAAVIEDCEKSDGEFLFSYQNANNEFVAITSTDVNSYLLEVSRESVTAKDFRTWKGSVIALSELCGMQENLSKTAQKRFISAAVKSASQALGNTPAVCRKSYIHSAILSAAETGRLPSIMQHLNVPVRRRTGLSMKEMTLVAFLTFIEEQNQKPIALPSKVAA